VTHVSNALGTIVPVKEVIRLAHEAGAKVLLDGSQAAPHRRVDVSALDVDFYAFTGHKVYGPSGIGVLYGKRDLLNAMPPYHGGGEMIRRVTFEETTYQDVPHRFEAGTPAIAEAIGLAAALRYMEDVGLEAIEAHEAGLLSYATEQMSAIPGLVIYGRASEKSSIVSFTMEGMHAHDIGTIVDRAGVAVRAGHHCAQPLMDRLGIPATARASFAIYNGPDDVDALVQALYKAKDIFG
ncbi:MAG: cysteine desulfurase, partial [Pseudomonadota bacterium]